MKKSIFILSIILLFAGCGNNISSRDKNYSTKQIQDSIERNSLNNSETNSSEAEFIESKHDGYYVMNKKDNRILVVSTEKKDFSSTGGVKEYYDATWLSNITNEIKIGQQVQFEIDGMVLDSYPGQAKAKEVSVVPILKPEASRLSVDEAVNHALTSSEVDRNKVMVVISIRYYQESKVWEIDLKETMGDREFTIRVNDN